MSYKLFFGSDLGCSVVLVRRTSSLLLLFYSKVLPRPPAEGGREALLRTYHGDADGVVKLVHEDADDGRGQQQQDQRVFELHTETENIFTLHTGVTQHIVYLRSRLRALRHGQK